jgi:hypothetical protein
MVAKENNQGNRIYLAVMVVKENSQGNMIYLAVYILKDLKPYLPRI